MDDRLVAYIARRQTVLAQVKQLLLDALKVKRPIEWIDDDVVLFGSGLGHDSVDALELVIAIESRFGIKVEEQRFRTSLRTVNSLVDLVLHETAPLPSTTRPIATAVTPPAPEAAAAPIDPELERGVRTIRTSVAWTERPSVVLVRVSGDDASDLVDRICTSRLALRDGQVLQSLMLREDGRPLADLLVGNDDGALFLAADGLTAEELVSHLEAHEQSGADAHIENLSATHTMVSLNGPFAWELMSALEGPEIIGFPYLTFYKPARDRVYFRAGVCGEYGYDLWLPRSELASTLDRIRACGADFAIGHASEDAFAHCAFESWAFDIRRPHVRDLTPFELQLRWRVHHAKSCIGIDAIREHSSRATRERLVGLAAAAPLAEGDAIYDGDTRIGRVLGALVSLSSATPIARALLDVNYAHPDIDVYHARRGDLRIPVRTVSPPFVANWSLVVNPQRHAFADRREIAAPPGVRFELP
jgi:acyl carrier protein